MIWSIIDILKETALKHKAVNTFKYLDLLLINAQPNNKSYQVVVETDPLFDSVRENHRLTINMNVLGFVDTTELETLDIASQIGLSIIRKAVADNRNLLALEDYSILLFTKKTDDVCSGARFTIRFYIPSFIDYCVEDDNFLTDEEYKEKIKEPDILNLGEVKEMKVLDLRK